MTGLLASVTSIDETAIALNAGADIIDLKNPSNGALGALPHEVIREVTRYVAGRLPVSATVGDLPADPVILREAIEKTAETGVNYIKVGLFGSDYYTDCIDVLVSQSDTGKQLIAVLFADMQPDFSTLIKRFTNTNLAGVMMDTADKSNGRLRSHMNESQLADFITQAKDANLLSGLAGSLSKDDVQPLLTFEPDYLGFRTALCSHGIRAGQISQEAVARIRTQIPSQKNTRLSA